MMSTMRKAEAPLVLQAHVAADLMIPDPISIRAEASIEEAMTLFTDKGIHAAPVIDEAGRPIGVLSRSDLLIHQCERAKNREGKPDYFFAPTFDGNAKADAARMTVAELMTPAVFAVSPDTPIQRVVSEMVGLHVHRLFVVDEVGVLVGVISTMDVLKHLALPV
jgi:CBS domain-containing protein